MKKEELYMRPEAEPIRLLPDAPCMLTTSTNVDDYSDPFTVGETW